MSMLKLYQAKLTPAQYAAGEGVICALPKALAPQVPQKINGDWSLSFRYPLGSLGSEQLALNRLVEADGQLYRIEDLDKASDENGEVLEVRCVHLMYDLRQKHIVNIETAETTPGGINQQTALDQVLQGTPFTRGLVDTDIVLDYLDILQKDAMWAIKEQILALWGGELQPDNWTINIRKKMGEDRGYQLRYGKNIRGVRLSESMDGVITRLHILGYRGANIEPINGGKDFIDSPHINLYAQPLEGLVTFADDDLPEDLLSKGQAYLATVDTPRISLSVNLAQVRGSVQYKHYQDLDMVELGDTVTVYHQRLGIDITARVQARQYNPVTGENLRVELGNHDANLYSHIASLQQAAEIIQMIADRKGHVRGERLRGVVDLLTTKLYASGAYTKAKVNDTYGILFENTDATSVDYGAMYIGPGIFAIASAKKADGSWDWRTFGTGKGFVGDELIAGSVTANKLASDVGQQLDISSNVAITQVVDGLAGKADASVVDGLGNIVTAQGTAITQNADEIALKADKTVTDGLDTRMQSAEQKITADAITQTVRNHTSYQSDLAGKNRTYLLATAPSGAITGDLWIDTANGNLLKRWTGTAWQAVQDGAISIAQQQADKIQWLVASGTSGSNMVLTDKLYELVTGRVMITAQDRIELAVGGVQVGGRNLLRYSNHATLQPGWQANQNVILTQESGWLKVVYNQNTSTPGLITRSNLLKDELIAGQEYTLSVKIKQNNTSRLYCVIGDVYFYIGMPDAGVNVRTVTFVYQPPASGDPYFLLYDNSPTIGTGFYLYWAKLEKGNKATDWSPAPSDPASGVKTAGINIAPDLLDLYSSAILRATGSLIDFDTNRFTLRNGDREMLSATVDGVAIGADVLSAQAYHGPIVQTHPGGTVPWKGSFAATLAGLPKYLRGDVTINVPAGTYNEVVLIRGFIGAKLIINLAAGVTITRYIDVRHCDSVFIYGSSAMTSVINVTSDYQGIYVESVRQLYIQYLRITGRVRTSANDGTYAGILLNAAIGEIMNCIIERTNHAIRCNRGCLVYALDNRGGVVGSTDYTTLANLSNGVQAMSGSHVGIYGTIPAAPTATSTFAGTIAGSDTPTGSPGTAPPPPTTVTRNYAQSVAAGWVVQDPSHYAGFNTSRLPQQGISNSYRFAGLWMLPAITNYNTASVAKLTITRAASGGSVNPVLVKLRYTTQAWSTISGKTYNSAGVNALFSDTGHEVSLARGDSVTITLSAAIVNLIKAGTIKGFGLNHEYYPWVEMSPTINLEVTTAT